MTTTTEVEHRISPVAKALAKDRLGVPLVTMHALSGSAPLTVVAAGTTTGYAITQNPGLALVYGLVAVVLMVFANGFVAMSRYIVNAGSFYTYIARGLGRTVGVAAAFTAKLAYNSMQVGLYGAFGAYLGGYAALRLGASGTWWVWALAGCAVIGVFGVLRIDLNGGVLGIVLASEMVLVIILDFVLAVHPQGGVYDFSALNPAHLAQSSFGAAAVTALAGFVGFEATTVFSEEARDPKRTIARATYLSLGLVGALYFASALIMTLAAGPGNIVGLAGEHTTELFFFLASPHVNAFLIDAGHLLVITSLFAALLAFHNTCARYAFALGREQVLPSALAAVGRRTGAPKGGSLFQTVVAFTVITGFAVAGYDPIVHLFFWLTTFGGLGVLVLMVLTSVAVLAFFTVTREGRDTGEGFWVSFAAPILSFFALVYILGQTLVSYHNLLGVPEGHAAAWMFPAGMAAVFGFGLLWAAWLKFARPDSYAKIGLGANASLMGR